MKLKERLYGAVTVKQAALKLARLFDCKIAVLTDDTLSKGIGKLFYDTLVAHGAHAFFLVLPCGEKCKTMETATSVCSTLQSLGFCRSDALIAVGGGSLCDLTGFVASIYKRGMRHAFAATTVLAAADAAVGGKTAVDCDGCKNMIGSFYEPEAVFILSEAFSTLPAQAMLSGMGEIFKCAVLAKERFCDITCPVQALARITAQYKLEVIKRDFYDKLGIRALLNLGHTFGHAIESADMFNTPHGIAVAQGVIIAAKIALAQGLLGKDKYNDIASLFFKLGFCLTSLSAEKLIPFIRMDKKCEQENIAVILPTDCGGAVYSYKMEELFSLLKAALAE